jgi:peptidoglycan hydrolase CwlO-like protein
LNRVID